MMVTSAEDVLSGMGLGSGQMKMDFGNNLPNSPIIVALSCGEKSVDELANVLKMPVIKLIEELLPLQLDGLIEESVR